MVNFLLGMLVSYIICGAVVFLTQTYCSNDFPIDVFITPFCLALYPIAVVILWPARIFRNVFKPTTFEALAKAKKLNPHHWHDYGYWGWCYDPDTKHFYDKFFLYRIKKGLTD